MEQDLKLATPSGIRDWPIGTAPTKRFVENKLADLFACWGYEEIITGTIEYEDTIAQGLNEEEKGQLYRFYGREGEALTLRPDMTNSQLPGLLLPSWLTRLYPCAFSIRPTFSVMKKPKPAGTGNFTRQGSSWWEQIPGVGTPK